MSYIGNKPATSFETVQKQISTSNSGTTITLDRAVTSVQDILLTIDAVVQSYDNYSVSGTTLTVGGTLSNNRVEILYVGRTMQSVDPTDDSVSAAKIKTDAVTTAKVQNDAITVDKLNLISTSSVPSLEAKGDGGSQDGYIQLNCSQNSHGVKIKSPPHSAGQSYTLTLPQSITNDYFLKTDGSGNLSFAEAGGGDLVKIGTVATDNSNVSALTIDNCFSSTYDLYRVVGFHNITSSGGHNYFRWRTGGASGSSYTTSDYNWINDGRSIKSSPSTSEYYNWNYSASHGRVASDMKSDVDADYVAFNLLIADPNTNVMARGYVTGTSVVRQNTDSRWVTQHVGIRNTANVNATGFEMTVSTGYISYGRVTVYGMKQA